MIHQHERGRGMTDKEKLKAIDEMSEAVNNLLSDKCLFIACCMAHFGGKPSEITIKKTPTAIEIKDENGQVIKTVCLNGDEPVIIEMPTN